MINNSAGGKARGSVRAALECNNQKMDPSCTECTDIPPVRAVILYPNLGTPLILPPGEKKINIFIAAEGKSHRLFGTTTHSKAFPQPSVLGYMYVDKHLRVYPIAAKKLSDNTKEGRLWNDGKVCSKAFSHVKVWCLGPLGDGTITDIDGKMIANLRGRTIDGYNSTVPAHPDDEDPLVENPPLEWIYQIQIDLAALPNAPAPGKMVSLAWMMQLPDGYKKQKALAGMSDWEYQDKLIYDFLEAQKKNPLTNHVPDLYEFDVPTATASKLPRLKKEVPRRLKAWHPVSIGKNATLKIGHLSDVHVNSRHFALASSTACMLEGFSDKVGGKVDNCFMALKELFDNMKAAGADAVFLTGDLLDFNRNLDPREMKGGAPKEQWPLYDLNSKISDTKLYPRGIDDMLIFSLLRYSYEKLKMPVYITTGNHEAYDVPYGISPRASGYVLAAALKQIANDKSVVIPSRLTTGARYSAYVAKYSGANYVAGKAGQAANKVGQWSDRAKNIPYVGEPWRKVTNKKDELLDRAVKKLHDWHINADPNEVNLPGTHLKMNEGIPADHNLSIYEACLIYGPTFPQVIKPFNFTPANFDWFFMLFTPLADFRVDYKDQLLLGLDWGDSEIMVNLDIKPGEMGQMAWDGDSDVMGHLMGLPRADKSLNPKQRQIVEQSSSSGKKMLLFTHFTLINYESKFPLDHKSPPFPASDAKFSDFTKGTFSIGRDFLYPKLNNGIHYTLAGHSHRAGAYALDNGDPRAMTSVGFQPSAYQKPNAVADQAHGKLFASASTTRVVVSSCGGPIGTQNMKGEMFGWNLMPPSGTLVDITANGPKELQRVTTKKYLGGKPRFCVALDYIQMHAQKQVLAWVPMGDHAHYWLIATNIPYAAPFIDKVALYAWDSDTDAFAKFDMAMAPTATDHIYDSYIIGYQDLFEMIFPANGRPGPPVFAEVKFNKALAGNPYYEHYNFDDPWIFRLDVQKEPKFHPQLRPAEERRGEFPDYRWLGEVDSAKYPGSPKSIKS